MSEVLSSVSPLHGICTIGQPYGNPSSDYTCGFHTGIDFPGSGVLEGGYDLYSCCEGTVVYTYKNSNSDSPSLGNQVQIKDDKTGYYYRYCHLEYGSITVNVGDKVTTSTKIGVMGNTGNSSGRHLHLELSKTQAWVCSNFLSPGEYLGFGNERGTIIKYDGESPSPDPPTPISKNKKNNWKWFFLITN